MNLTDLSIKALKAPPKGYLIYHDDTLAGFGVRVTSKGVKSYVLTHGPRRRRETLGSVGILSLKTARGEAKRLLAEYTLGKTNPRIISWSKAVDEYLEEIEGHRRKATLDSYRKHLKGHFRYGDTRMVEVMPDDLHKDLDRLRNRPSTRHHAFTSVRAFMRWAHRKHYLDKNPLERMKAPEGSKPRARFLTDDELKKVWNACEDDTFGRLVKCLLLLGQRRGEIAGSTSDMVQRDRLVLPSWLTKNGRVHSLPLPPLALSLLTTGLTSKSASPSTLFPARGKTSSFNGFSTSKTALDKRSGVTDWTLHDLRRTFASNLAKLGVPLHVIERLLNHVSGSFAGVAGIYNRHDYFDEMKSALELWEERIQTIVA